MRKYRLLFLGVLLIALAAVLSGCKTFRMCAKLAPESDTVYETQVGEFDCSQVSLILTYTDGESDRITLTEDMIPSSEYLKFFHPGEQKVKVVYDNVFCEIPVFVSRHVMDGLVFACDPITYDGQPHTITVEGDLPSGATVQYPLGNTFTVAGEHHVVAAVSCEGYETAILASTMVIERADFDISGIRLEDKTVSFNGSVQTVTADNVPSGVSVAYDVYSEDGKTPMNEAFNAGTYTVKMSVFVHDLQNYKPIEEPLEAKLTILPLAYDMSAVSMQDKTVVYDGKEHVIMPTGRMPDGVQVASYHVSRLLGTSGPLTAGTTPLEAKNAGKYLITVQFQGDTINHLPIPGMSAVLTIEKQIIDVSNISLRPFYCDFDGAAHAVTVDGKLPDDVAVTYTYNGKAADSVSAAGFYQVAAYFQLRRAGSGNYEFSTRMIETTMIIREITYHIEFSNDSVSYNNVGDGEARYRVSGLEEGIIAELTFQKDGETVPADQLVRGEHYTYYATFSFADPLWDASASIPPVFGETNLREEIVVPTIEFPDMTVTYDGQPHKMFLGFELPDGAVTYYNNERTDAGTNEVTAVIDTDRFILVDAERKVYNELSALLTVTKRTVSLSHLKMEPVSVVYDGQPHSILIEGELPDWVTVDYNYSECVRGGIYQIVGTFVYDTENNQLPFGSMSAQLTIRKLKVTAPVFSFDAVDVTYDGNEHSTYLYGADVPKWATVEYKNNVSTNACQWTAKATLVYDEQSCEVEGKTLYEASFVIRKATIDLSGLDFSTQTYYWKSAGMHTGERYGFVIDETKLPDGVRALTDLSYLYGIGRFTDTIWFYGDNYQDAFVSATVEIRPTESIITAQKTSMRIGYTEEWDTYYVLSVNSYLRGNVEYIRINSVKDAEGVSYSADHVPVGKSYTVTVEVCYNWVSDDGYTVDFDIDLTK